MMNTPLKPWTDSAFLLARLLSSSLKSWVICEFVKKIQVGCDDSAKRNERFFSHGRKLKPGNPAEYIARVAREFAAAGKMPLPSGWRTSYFINSFQTDRAIATLYAIVALY
jgi:thiosulfate reductase/polysulfide reductase chain A